MATTTLASTAISSPRSSASFYGRSGWQRARRGRPQSSSSSGQGGCGRPLDRVAGWVGGGIAAAFFASLECCSCVNVRTHDDLDDDEQRDSLAPLMFDDGNDEATGADAGGRRRRRRGGGRRNEKGRSGGGGMGCYGD